MFVYTFYKFVIIICFPNKDIKFVSNKLYKINVCVILLKI